MFALAEYTLQSIALGSCACDVFLLPDAYVSISGSPSSWFSTDHASHWQEHHSLNSTQDLGKYSLLLLCLALSFFPLCRCSYHTHILPTPWTTVSRDVTRRNDSSSMPNNCFNTATKLPDRSLCLGRLSAHAPLGHACFPSIVPAKDSQEAEFSL